ncbi:MAG: adenylosuccinate lyase [Phycisphaerae bacterium]|nr:adenylosuccinate lyase [Phycisphaerae bacterium]
MPTQNPNKVDERRGYRSPLSGRYASKEMQAIWSDQRKFESWRRFWVALAEAQHELGLPVSLEQVRALRARIVLTDEDHQRAEEHERRLRHDVMAHVHAFGDAATIARGIIHLGATSQDVNCNTETALIREAMDLVCVKAARVIDALGTFALKWKSHPCLGLTHYQPAQPTTVGKRAAMWASELALAIENAENAREALRFRGLKGATGTQASFLGLFDGDAAKVGELEQRVAEKLGWKPAALLVATGQTYPRLADAIVVSALACIAATLHKTATDIRLLSGRKELDEPFETEQIGSSAMPYKRNPMRSERACGLCRFVMSLPASALDTAATQWLERTLDDSANRRLVLPEAFLALDGALDLMHNVASGLIVHEGAIRRNLDAEMPFLATENLMLAAAKLGRDRQRVHEAIRRHAQEAGTRVKDGDGVNDLLDRLRAEPLMEGVRLESELDPARYVGLAPAQVDRFVHETVVPLRDRYAPRWDRLPSGAPER